MRHHLVSRTIIGVALGISGASALAHGGHGAATEWHWHATDTLGFLLVAVLAGAALWFSRGK